jgi:hypothetical protein
VFAGSRAAHSLVVDPSQSSIRALLASLGLTAGLAATACGGRVDEGGQLPALATGQLGVLGLTADATAAYWATRGQFASMGNSDILAAPFAGGSVQKLACQFRMYGGIAVDDTDVYFISQGSTIIAKVPKHGG